MTVEVRGLVSQRTKSIQFVTGVLVGRVAHDIVRLGELALENFALLMVVDERASSTGKNPFTAGPFQGIVGLGTDQLLGQGETEAIVVVMERRTTGLSSMVQLLIKNLPHLQKSVTFAVPPANSEELQLGAVLVGGLDERLQSGDWKLLPSDSKSKYWEVPLQSIHFGSYKLCCDKDYQMDAKLVFDSGSTGNSFPSTELVLIDSLLDSATTQCTTTMGPQQLNKLFPNMTYHLVSTSCDVCCKCFQVDNITVVVTPEQYLIRQPLKDRCKARFMSADIGRKRNRFIAGTPFFTSRLIMLGSDLKLQGNITQNNKWTRVVSRNSYPNSYPNSPRWALPTTIRTQT
eukprot:Blabericola_migrator_1__1478@NODE_1391_length_4634_cov_199_307642_g931_i0_p3_GENE_NODE_1391_length_4634_cov_199_307642_g931_i0NODE_1391_length_4634_cov_199_307642_g931_i0_p3_ORF_typecomplete_len345_score28_02Asp/PF00026_23/6_6e22_NODE_1391_length_4634_cov_199_307642_g931_i06651699